MTKEGERTETIEAKPQKVRIGKEDIALTFVVPKPANLITDKAK